MFVFSNPLATNTARSSTRAANSGTNTFAGLVNPDMPRSLDIIFGAGWDGGNVTVVGTDQFDAAVTEVVVAVANSTVLGIKTFKTITSATKASVGASAAVAQLLCGTRIGIPARLTDTQALLVVKNTIPGDHPSGFCTTGSLANATYNNVQLGDPPNGSTLFSVVAQVFFP